MVKSPDAFRTISEVAAILETPAHVLRFWESKFPQIKPVKRAGGRRYFRPDDIALLGGIKVLLHEQGMTIRGVQKLLRERGPRHVATLSAMPWEGVEDDTVEAVGAVADADGPAEDATERAEEVEEAAPGPDAIAGPADEPPPSVIETVVASVAARQKLAEPHGALSVARLRAALAGADRDRLAERAAALRPLVRQLGTLGGGRPRPSA